jgi:hypothetical protein
MLMKERIDRHKDGTVKARGIPSMTCPKRGELCGVASKQRHTENLRWRSIPGRNFHGGGVLNVAMNGDGF